MQRIFVLTVTIFALLTAPAFAVGTGVPHANHPLHASQLTRGEALTRLAKRYLGTPYVWAGSTPSGFDCSGFVRFLYGRFGIDIPHSSYAQWGLGRHVVRNDMRPGDIVFFGMGHVGIWLGNGRFIHSWGSRGSEPGQFSTPHGLAIDAQGNIYVADQGNKRIQVFDNAGVFKSQIANVGVPGALCITAGPHQYLFSAHTGDLYGMDDAAIYKVELDGRVAGKFGKAGKLPKELGLVNALDCRSEHEVYVGELSNWRVQKLILKQ